MPAAICFYPSNIRLIPLFAHPTPKFALFSPKIEPRTSIHKPIFAVILTPIIISKLNATSGYAASPHASKQARENNRMNNKPSMSKRATRITTALALVAVMSVAAVSLLMTGAGGATAFNADASARAIPAQYTEQCSNGIAVPNLAYNPGLVEDCATLLALKDTLAGARSNRLDTWSANRPINRWSGVTIEYNRVTRLSLHNISLNGAIPAELGNLANLRSLSLGYNDLKGAIPSELGNLANLEYLHLGHNDLVGAIPAELGNLANSSICISTTIALAPI